MSTDKNVREAEIRAVIGSWANAIRTKNAAAVVSHQAPGFVQYSLAPPLTSTGVDKAGLEAWFSSWKGPLGYEVRDLNIDAGEDVAFSRSLNRLSGTSTSGEKSEIWFRQTLCFRKIDGEWKVAHEHESVPFYMDGSYRAAVDLEP